MHTAQICMTLHNRLTMDGEPAKIEDFHPMMVAEAEKKQRALTEKVQELVGDRKELTNDEKERIWRMIQDA